MNQEQDGIDNDPELVVLNETEKQRRNDFYRLICEKSPDFIQYWSYWDWTDIKDTHDRWTINHQVVCLADELRRKGKSSNTDRIFETIQGDIDLWSPEFYETSEIKKIIDEQLAMKSETKTVTSPKSVSESQETLPPDV